MSLPRKCLWQGFFLLSGVLCFLAAPSVRGQKSRQGPTGDIHVGTIIVNIRNQDGSNFDQGAVATLYSFEGGSMGTLSAQAGRVEFDSIPPGRYTVEVIAPGYQRLTEPVELPTGGQQVFAYVVLKPDNASNAGAKAAGPPILAPGAQKEFNKALEALRATKPDEAKKHLEKLSRGASGNPDVDYLWGTYYAELNDWPRAKSYWQNALQIYPGHVLSLAALAECALKDGDLSSEISYLQRAEVAAPSSWRFQELLARAYLDHQEYEPARKHAEHAIELGKERAVLAQLVLAKVLVRFGEQPRAEKALEAVLAGQPSETQREEASRLLAELRAPKPAAAPAPATAPPPAPAEATKPDPASVSVAKGLVPETKWMPPDVDENVPTVETGVACPLQRVVEESGKRVREFVDAVNRITATEELDHETVDRYGFPSRRETRNYTYVASVQENRPGTYSLEEYRNGTIGLDVFPAHLATVGLPSLVLVFHPAYRDEYEFTCEGLSRWHGAKAWQVHFRQRADKPARLLEYRVNSQGFAVSLRGRAWISAETFQVVSLESDLVAPISQIRLNAEHISIEYMPVDFRKRQEQLWLPQSAEMFLDFDGRHVHRRHHFSNYLLFSVDDRQKISTPAAKVGSNPASLSPQ